MRGSVIWLAGISGAGKSTLGNLIAGEFRQKELPVQVLDGDEVRSFFENDIGYTKEERIMNVRRITFAAYVLSLSGINVVVANIAPYYEARDFIRKKLSPYYVQIYVNAPTSEVSRRDVKGNYLSFQKGELSSIVGLDQEFEAPRNPDLEIKTNEELPHESLKKIVQLMRSKNIF